MKQFIIILSACVLIYADNGCIGTDIPYEGRCYRFKSIHGTFNNSNKDCMDIGGSLATIVNLIQNNALAKFAIDNLDKSYKYFWIGGTDLGQVGDWFWIDGSPFNFSQWEINFPIIDRHCVAVQLSNSRWVNEECTNQHQFLCEYLPNTISSTSGYTCPPCDNS